MNARRRTVLAAGAAGAAALVVGCSENGDEGATTPEPTSAPPTPTTPSESGPAQPTGEELARTSEIPAGGGKVFADQKVVVTQPTAGQFKAFSAVCTHQGCTVRDVADGTINCPCHGSKFRVADASVAAGPAPGPLPPEQITVSGDRILLT